MLNPFPSIVSIRSFPCLPLSIPLSQAFSPPVSPSHHLSLRFPRLRFIGFIGFLPCPPSMKRQLRTHSDERQSAIDKATIHDESTTFDIFLHAGSSAMERPRSLFHCFSVCSCSFSPFFSEIRPPAGATGSAPQKKEYASSSRWLPSHSARDRNYLSTFVLPPSLVTARRNMERIDRFLSSRGSTVQTRRHAIGSSKDFLFAIGSLAAAVALVVGDSQLCTEQSPLDSRFFPQKIYEKLFPILLGIVVLYNISLASRANKKSC